MSRKPIDPAPPLRVGTANDARGYTMEEVRDGDLLALSDKDFVAVWTALLGEPPAAVIDRPEMVELLLRSIPAERHWPDAGRETWAAA